MTLRIGLLVNPLAGLGGSVALKGSDGADTVAEALRRGASPQAPARAARALAHLPQDVTLLTWGGPMGEDSVREAGRVAQVLGQPATPSDAADTRRAASELLAAGIDLLLFAGGDGTARDLVDAVGQRIPVLGIPAGCKMHSAVYAVNPEAAAELAGRLSRGEALPALAAEVRDIDEEAFRQGVVRARHYGALKVPGDPALVQQVKCGGREMEDLQITEIAAHVVDHMEPDTLYLMGSGSTVAEVMAQLGLENTLLGVDAVLDHQLVGQDLTAAQMLALVSEHKACAVLSVIGGQGHLFGRGNQQFSPPVIRALGRDHLLVLASRLKLATLDGRPLLVDTGDAALDQALAGLVTVVAGYEDEVLYRLATNASAQP